MHSTEDTVVALHGASLLVIPVSHIFSKLHQNRSQRQKRMTKIIHSYKLKVIYIIANIAKSIQCETKTQLYLISLPLS